MYRYIKKPSLQLRRAVLDVHVHGAEYLIGVYNDGHALANFFTCTVDHSVMQLLFRYPNLRHIDFFYFFNFWCSLAVCRLLVCVFLCACVRVRACVCVGACIW